MVAGIVIGVDNNAIHAADQWEEIPFYRREKVCIMLDDDTTLQAWAYTRRDGDGSHYTGTQLSAKDREQVINAVESLKKQKERITLPFCDVYLMVPCSVSEKYILIHKYDEQNIRDTFLQSFAEVSNAEFSGCLASQFKRSFLSEIEIITFSYSDLGEKSEAGRQRIRTYLTLHEKTSLAVVTFTIPACSVSAHDLLNQMSREDICLSSINDSSIIMNMTEWINKIGLFQSGTPRASVILSSEPKREDLHALLAAEADPIDEITSNDIKVIAETNISQYLYYKMYVSETCEVEIPANFGNTYEDRVFDAILTLFIIELILFQDASLTLVQSRVSSEITRAKYKSNNDGLRIIEDLGETFANAMLFWNIRNFRYKTAQNLADAFAEAFGIERLRKNYIANHSLLEQLIQIHSARTAEKENRIITALLVVLTTIQVIPIVFSAFLSVIDGTIVTNQFFASIFSISICSIIWLVFLSRKNRKRIDDVLSWISSHTT